MMGKPINEYRLGSVRLTEWEGEYKGKKTESFSLKKSFFKDNAWRDTDFYNSTDLRDLYLVVGALLHDKVRKKEAKVSSTSKTKSEESHNEVPIGEEPPFEF